MRFGELFAGAGGLSLGLERAGWTCAWHAEIADAPRAILSHRWPDVPLLGDVTTIDGRELVATYGPIDLLSGGSPCQDLSVAGKRKGLEGTRSGLFFEQMRLWDETGADLCLWENVDGARSSNNGRDFGEVLRAFVGAAVPVPSDGWRSAGVAAGPLGVAAWRVLDAQFFGVPQRRRRVFVLGTRTGRVDPAEVLSLAESVRGDSQESGEAREGSAPDAAPGPEGVRWVGGAQQDEFVDPSGIVGTLAHASNHHMGHHEPKVFAFNEEVITSPTHRGGVTEERTSAITPAGRTVIAFDAKQDGDKGLGTISPTLTVGADGGPKWIGILGEVSHALTHEGADASEGGTGRGTPIICGTLRATDGGPDVDLAMAGHVVANSICAREAKGWEPEAAVGNGTITHGIPRRLTPRECERLMGWEDDHTLVPFNGKPLSDSARYKACGNGVASVHSHWIGWRLALALNAERVA